MKNSLTLGRLYGRRSAAYLAKSSIAKKAIVFIISLVMLAGLGGKSWGQVALPHLDPINYTAGQSLTVQTGWTLLNTSTSDLLIATGNLSYSGLVASSGNKVAFSSTGEDAAKLFTQQTSGTIYYSFLLNITSLGSLNATGGYFTSFTESSTTTFGGTVWTRLDGAGYDIGINPRTTAANTVWSGIQSINTTLLIVISYQIVSGTTNDVVKLWINPTPGSAEPAATLSSTNTLADLANVNRILIRQDGASATPFIEMDELRIGTTWAAVTPASAAPTLSVGALTAFGSQCISSTYGPNSFTITGTNLTTADITVGALSGFTYSTTSGGAYTSTLTLTHSAGAYSQDIFVKFSPTAVQSYNGNIAVGGGGATSVNCAAAGSGISTPSAPTAGTHTPSQTQIVWNWSTVSGASYKYNTINDYASATDNSTSTSYTQTSLTCNTAYTLYVWAYNSCGYSSSVALTQTTSSCTSTPTAWINEFHYENTGTDVGEAIEIVIVDPGSFTLSNFQVNLYNGSGGASYLSQTVNNFTVGATSGSATIYTWAPTAGLFQNGDPDGIALSYNGTLIQFLSYGGAFAATGGPANGVTSTDIGLIEASTSAVGNSLQLSGSGCVYSNFTWQGSAANTMGAVNNSQTLCSSCTAPTTQSSALTFASVGPDQMTVNWTSGNGSKRIVIMNTSNTFTNPTDGTDPTADPIYAGSGQQVVYNDAGSSVTVSDLTPGTTYWYRVYDYNCTGTSSKYITATATNNPNSQATTSCAAPTTQASALTFSAVGTNQMTVNWTNGNGANRVVIMNTANSFTNPANGTSPAANSIYDGSGEQVVYNNNSNSVTVTGLNPATTYWFRVYENNCSGTFTVYQTSTAGNNPLSQATTACAAPTTQATALAFSGISNDQMTVNWTNGNGSKRIVILNTANSFTSPVNATDPAANSTYSGTGEQVVYNGTASSVTVTGLNSATTYYYKVFEANCNGASVFFYTPDATGNPGSQATTSSTFSACGNQGFADGFTEPGGWTFTGITSTYATSGNYGISSPSVKFDDELDEIETAEVSGPTQLSFWIKGLSINPNSEFLIEGWDGDSWETLELIKPIPTVGTTKTYGSVATYSKFRFNYSKKMAGNVAIDDVNITCGACVLTTFPQLETFDAVGEPNLPCGWTQTNNNADGEYWITSSANPYSGDNSMYISNNSALAMDDWFFTPKLTLVGGTIYNISFYYRAGLNTYTEKLEVKWGTAATAAGMTSGTIFTNAAITNESYTQGTGPFTPGSSGDYYIGFHGYSAANQIEIYVDDILITNCSGAPAAPVTSAATSIGGTYFTANWSSVAAANKYFLDVATDAAFTAYVTGFTNKDVGNVTSYNISGLNINTTYYYRVRSNNSCGTSAHSGTINLTTLATTTSTTIDYGDLVILAVNANMGSGGSACVTGSNNGDEISFMCFVDITNGTQFQITDNPYERDYSGSDHWGNTEGGAVLTRTGGTIPAGTVITFRTDMTAAHNIVFIQPDAAWSVANLGTNAISTMFNLNNGGDQIYVAQDGQWYGGTNTCATNTCPPSGSGTSACHNATFPGTGRLLFAFSTNPSPHWTASCSANPTQRSNLYPGMECLNMAPTGSSDWNKYVGLLTPATQREWIDRINDPTSWSSYSSCTNYDANGPQYDDGMVLTILTGGFANGHWNGSVNIDWFNCANWQSMKVPDSNTNVVIPQSGVLYDPTIGAPPTGITTAYSNDLSVELLRTLTINNASSKLSIYGSFLNDGTLSHTLGTVTLAGSANTTLGGSAPLTFYNLTLNKKNFPFKITLSEDIATSSIFTLNKGKMLTGSYIIYVQNNVPGAVVAGANNTLFANSYIIGSINRMITANTSTYDFPVGILSNPRLAQFVNNNISATTLTATYDSTALIGNTGTLNVYEGTTLLTNLCMEGVWQIDPNAALTSGNYGLKLWFNGYSSLSAADDNNFTIIKRPNPPTAPGDFGTFTNGNGTINPLNGLGRLYSNGYAYKYNLAAFSQFAIAKANTPLPVELLFFAALCTGNAIEINWQTATETNNDYFSLERSADAKNFKKIADVRGAGNSNDVLNYSFIDADPLDGTSYYRLVQNDYNGYSEIFGPVTARCEGIGESDFQIVQVNNDGVNPQITYYISSNLKVTICVYDINGRRILCAEQAGAAGNRIMNLDIKTGAGLYFISLTDGDKVLSTRVFMK